MKHVNSHIVVIKRLGTFLSRAQAKVDTSFISTTKEGIGAYFENQSSGRIGSGLTLNEEKILMPEIVNTPANDRDFRKKVAEFFNEINTPVPETGVELEVGLSRDNTQPVSDEKGKENMPVNLTDYIRWRHAKGHPWVVESKETGEGNMIKKYYIFDKDAISRKKTEGDKEKDAALAIYLKVKETPMQVDQMLTLMGEDIRSFLNVKDKDREVRKAERLRELAESKSTDFKRIYDEGELEVKAWIGAMITTGVLKQVGSRIYDAETRDEIGNGMDEAVLFFKNEDQSVLVSTLKARLQEANLAVPEEASRRTVVTE